MSKQTIKFPVRAEFHSTAGVYLLLDSEDHVIPVPTPIVCNSINSHDELVSALKGLTELVEDCHTSKEDVRLIVKHYAFTQAKQALMKVISTN